MNEATAAALEESIRHWEENLELAKKRRLIGNDIGCLSCALCQMFMVPSGTDCDGCPVQLRTGCSKCRDTPWSNVFKTIDGTGDLVVAVEAEIDFLKSLREESCS